jgi:hypothetical protein
MRVVRLIRCPRQLAVCSLLAVILIAGCATADAAPYVSCPGGYIAPNIGDCPDIPESRGGAREPHQPGGAPRGGGVLSDLLGSIGLGGLGGLL